MSMDLKTARALTSPEARETLVLFRNMADDPLSIQESFRGMFPEKVARAMGELRALRRRAAQKFDRGLDLFFTKQQLEQSSSERVATWRARRFVEAGAEEVWDPCCGMGADAIALGRAGLRVHASDCDPVAVHFARTNVETYELDGKVEVGEADAAEAVPGARFVYLDPARRKGARRLIDPAQWSPAPDTIAAWLAGAEGACLKLSPSIPVESLLEHFPPPDEIEVVSLNGEVKEMVFWYGALAGPNGRCATILPEELSFRGDEEARAPVGEAAELLYDPDPALVRAGLLGRFAREHGLHVLDPEIGYLTGDDLVDSPFVDAFRVVAWAPLDPRKMRALLRDHEVGRLEIRKRGIAERPETLRKRLLPKPLGERRLTLVAVRVGDRHLGFLCEPPDA